MCICIYIIKNRSRMWEVGVGRRRKEWEDVDAVFMYDILKII